MSQNTERLSQKVENAAGAAIATYAVAKSIKAVRDSRRPPKVEQPELAPMTPPKTAAERPLSEGARHAFNLEKTKLKDVKQYLVEYMRTPSSVRKLLPRGGVYHAPWAYHGAPTYASLHLDQSEFDTPQKTYPYKSGIEKLAALGKEPLKAAVAHSVVRNPGSEWKSLFSSDDLLAEPSYVVDAKSARVEKKRIVGLWAAVEGMGFDSDDMTFARWDGNRSEYKVVPYDPENELHQIVAASSPHAVEGAQEAGLMLRTVDDRRELHRQVSVDVSVVDIAALRAEKGDLIPPTPDPRMLAQQPYYGQGAVPSTQQERYAA